ncbi:MAG: hypothetical protein ACYC3S_18590 [Chloroflexota bacterium]
MKIRYLIAATICIAALVGFRPPLTLGEETAYNFASARDVGTIVVPTNGEGSGRMYFYNVDGNRITHITLMLRDGTPGWEARLEPAAQTVAVEVDGVSGEVEENLFVEPSTLLSEPVMNVPAGSECIAVPGRGYALARTARLVVRPPQNAKPGDKATFMVTAEAQWLGQAGAAAIKQARNFEFTAQVATPGTHVEKVLGPADQQRPANSLGSFLAALPDSWLAAGAGLVLAMLAVSWRRNHGRGHSDS